MKKFSSQRKEDILQRSDHNIKEDKLKFKKLLMKLIETRFRDNKLKVKNLPSNLSMILLVGFRCYLIPFRGIYESAHKGNYKSTSTEHVPPVVTSDILTVSMTFNEKVYYGHFLGLHFSSIYLIRSE